jgi:hypothetical protein
MPDFYVNNNAQANGDHEVHQRGCSFFPVSTTPLGNHATCVTAVQAAKKVYRQSNGCYYCSTACHTQ